MFKPTGRRSRHVSVVSALVLVATGAAWAGGSPLAAGAAEEVPMCFGMPATIIGTSGDDTLTGTPGDDVIVGLEGTDVIDAPDGGTDRICAGPNDLSLGAGGVPRYERITFNGSAFVDGGPGLDSIGAGYVINGEILGGSNPTVRDARGRIWRERIGVSSAQDVEIFSGDGPDNVAVFVECCGGTAKVDAGAGHDLAKCSGDFGSRCELHGGRGTGKDRLSVPGDIFHVKVFGGSGNDRLSARSFSILLDGGLGDDVLLSELADDDTLRGGPGRDRLTTNNPGRSSGPHVLQGGTGADNLVGIGAHAEVFGGGPGSDTVRAGGGSDKAWGGAGRDVLGGAGGRDSLYGGAGLDDNYGGPGSDLCRSPQKGPRAHSCQR